MDNRTLAQKFSEGATSGKGSHMFIEGDTIYSYGHHFPIAKRLPDGKVLFNTEGYSSTTAKQKSYVRRALNDSDIVPSTTKGIQQGIPVERKYPNSLKGFRDWQYDHPNIMTPGVNSVKKEGDYYIEVSEGTGIRGEPLYGVSVIKYNEVDNTYTTMHDKAQRNSSFAKKEQADAHASTLKTELKNLHKMEKRVEIKHSGKYPEVQWADRDSHERRQDEADEQTQFDRQLQKGIAVEMEHTSDRKVAEKIARDHLAEIPDYYTRLNKLENQAKKEGVFTPSLGIGLGQPVRSSTRRAGRSRRSM